MLGFKVSNYERSIFSISMKYARTNRSSVLRINQESYVRPWKSKLLHQGRFSSIWEISFHLFSRLLHIPGCRQTCIIDNFSNNQQLCAETVEHFCYKSLSWKHFQRDLRSHATIITEFVHVMLLFLSFGKCFLRNKFNTEPSAILFHRLLRGWFPEHDVSIWYEK